MIVMSCGMNASLETCRMLLDIRTCLFHSPLLADWLRVWICNQTLQFLFWKSSLTFVSWICYNIFPCESEFIAKLTIYKCISFPVRVWHFALLIKRTDIMQKSFIKGRRKLFLPELWQACHLFWIGKALILQYVSTGWVHAGLFHAKVPYGKLSFWNSAAMELFFTFQIERIWHVFIEFTLEMLMVFLCDHYVVSNVFL